MIKIGLRVFVRENRAQNVKNVNGRGSTEQVHTNIIDRSGGVIDKYTKHRFFTVFVLEIRASLYSTPSDAIFVSKFAPFSQNPQNLTSEVFFVRDSTQHRTTF